MTVSSVIERRSANARQRTRTADLKPIQAATFPFGRKPASAEAVAAVFDDRAGAAGQLHEEPVREHGDLPAVPPADVDRDAVERRRAIVTAEIHGVADVPPDPFVVHGTQGDVRTWPRGRSSIAISKFVPTTGSRRPRRSSGTRSNRPLRSRPRFRCRSSPRKPTGPAEARRVPESAGSRPLRPRAAFH